ncbi:hypothetical protein [Tenacibaculum jejuense]|uniref:Bacteriocin n=1 Tax=Tenacibaculum jejuense TaxID=584609 RepID=A0A238UAW5_9FLAO|nr:hypothetical protein [Tenacibaculum jejuense]SNR15624.1 protein of unknown function [Tenacibaculum jejuense]
MKNSILNLGKALNKKEQQLISGGSGRATCPQYSAQQCNSCGGFSLFNGCCLGTAETHCCLTGACE